MHLYSFCFVLTRMPVYISLALNYFQHKKTFSDNAKIIGRWRFSSKALVGSDCMKKVEDQHLQTFYCKSLVCFLNVRCWNKKLSNTLNRGPCFQLKNKNFGRPAGLCPPEIRIFQLETRPSGPPTLRLVLSLPERPNCVLHALPRLHSLCVENWLSHFHCDLINN